MPNQLATPFHGPQPWEAPDPLPVMRRELKLLLIEINVLRVEVQQLRAMEQDARARPRNSFRPPSSGSWRAATTGDEKRNASTR